MFNKTVTRSIHTTPSNLFLFKKAAKHLANTAPKEYNQFELKTPCGLAEPPKSNVKYVEGNSFKEMFDEQKTTERTKELEKEFQQSGFHDLYAFEKTKGKLFISPPTYWKRNICKYFPHMVGQQLSSKTDMPVEDSLRGKITVLKMCGNKVGEDMINTFFITPTKDNYLKTPSKILDELNRDIDTSVSPRDPGYRAPVQIAEINLIDNALKSYLLRLFGNTLSKIIPEERHDSYFMCNRNQLPFGKREAVNINNVYSGYVFIIDPSLKIRWMACGTASPEEMKLLWDSVRAIQKESLN